MPRAARPAHRARLGLEGGAGNGRSRPTACGRSISSSGAPRSCSKTSMRCGPGACGPPARSHRPPAAGVGLGRGLAPERRGPRRRARASWSGRADRVGRSPPPRPGHRNLIANAIEHGGGMVEVHGQRGTGRGTRRGDRHRARIAGAGRRVGTRRSGRSGGRGSGGGAAGRSWAAGSRSRDRGCDRRRPGRPARGGAVGAWRTAGAGVAGGTAGGGAGAGGSAAGGRRQRLRAAAVAGVGVRRRRGWLPAGVIADGGDCGRR